jgi:ribonuclease-3
MEGGGGASSSNTPYNPKNKMLTPNALNAILARYGVDEPYRDISLYRLAFVHKSYCTRKNENFINGNVNCPPDCIFLQEANSERLEFLGDSVLGMAVADYVYERFPESEEGFLTKVRTKLVNGQMLAFLSKEMGLGEWVILSRQIDDNGGRSNVKILEDTFEALLGALFLDFGYAHAKAFVVELVETTLDMASLVMSNTNFKDTFLKYYQQNHNDTPRFYELHVNTTKLGGKEYSVCMKNKQGNVLSTGKGSNKKAAEMDAAYNAMIYFGLPM